MPLYQLLGGASRHGLMAYGHASGRDLPELFDSIREHLELGFRSIRVQTARAGLQAVYGVAAQPSVDGSGTTTSRPQRTPLPVEEDWDTRAYLRHLPGGLRGGPQRVRPRAAAAARRPPPDDPDPGRQARQGPRTVRPVLAGGLHPGREPGGAAAGPAAHHHPAGDRRGLQHGVGLPDPDPRAAHRLRPLRGHPHRRDHRACASCSTTRRSTRSSPACTARPTSPRSAWPRRST